MSNPKIPGLLHAKLSGPFRPPRISMAYCDGDPISTQRKGLKRDGAVEYGTANSIVLAASHVSFGAAAVAESACGIHQLSHSVSLLAISVYVAAALVLVAVIRSLGGLWTIKLIIAPQHRLVTTGLFSFVRHPNYVLSVVPELVGFALALNAYWTLLFGLPAYLLPLLVRIRQEERIMVQVFPKYR
ncbi:isoprenylcysteine carboxylmethyltransferase family protein [Agrobacterium pusense]|uniref:isoprenylcysteine carboxylmethyltransferase family protein n=1 Tax=Agrobacterium pusense TaxID=648995 RepID=UPI00098F613A|nr:isoprenylcysteine carboxylmethyltransferase family protein [Agrobacterium pusense]WKD48078.1 DUF1295 domain-containing protein [Agrobacterium pusense]